MTHSLPAKLARFEGRFAILANAEFGEIAWPIKYLADDINVNGDAIISVASAGAGAQTEAAAPSADSQKYATMHKMLEELIN